MFISGCCILLYRKMQQFFVIYSLSLSSKKVRVGFAYLVIKDGDRCKNCKKLQKTWQKIYNNIEKLCFLKKINPALARLNISRVNSALVGLEKKTVIIVRLSRSFVKNAEYIKDKFEFFVKFCLKNLHS